MTSRVWVLTVTNSLDEPEVFTECRDAVDRLAAKYTKVFGELCASRKETMRWLLENQSEESYISVSGYGNHPYPGMEPLHVYTIRRATLKTGRVGPA